MKLIPDSEYLAGPMTFRPYFNFPAFDSLAAQRRREGHTVFNPHERDQIKYPGIDQAQATIVGDVKALGEEIGFTMAGAMEWDLVRVIESNRIVLLPEWEASTGAKAERFVAEMVGTEVWLASRPRDLSGYGSWVVQPDPVQKRLTIAFLDLQVTV